MRLKTGTLLRLLAAAIALAIPAQAVSAMDAIPGVADSPPPVDPRGANQGAFPYYYNAGLPNDDDLVEVGKPSGAATPSPELRVPEKLDAGDAAQAAFPGVYDEALLLQSKTSIEVEISRTRAAFGLLKSYSESGEMEEAAEIFATIPPFGDNILINAFRADAANLLILGYCRDKELPRAREIYDSLPKEIPGDEAMLAKGRATINLTTYYVMSDGFNEAYSILGDIGWLKEQKPLESDLFKLMARMIPYLDNAGEAEKAHAIYKQLTERTVSPETARLFADNFPGLPRYLLQYAKNADSRPAREQRLEFLHLIFESLDPLAQYPEIAFLRINLAGDLVNFYTEAGELDRARGYYEVMQNTDRKSLLPKKNEAADDDE